MRFTPSLALAATLALGAAGCVGLGTVSKIDVSNLASGTQSVKLKSAVTDSGAPADTGFTPWSRKDIQTIVVDLYELSGPAESIVFRIDSRSTSPYSRSLTSEDLDSDIILDKLVAGTTYRARARAFARVESSALISSETSFADFKVNSDSGVPTISLPISLTGGYRHPRESIEADVADAASRL
ncbi:MAG: hypothetical protein VKP72_08620 [bacterium]|nr:hypothetical protein [bacterium]